MPTTDLLDFLETKNEEGDLDALYKLSYKSEFHHLKENILRNSLSKCVLAISGDNFKLHHPRIYFPDMSEEEHRVEELKAKGKMLALKEFIDEHFEECLIFIGDELIRLGLMVSFEISEAQSREWGRELMKGFTDFAEDIFPLHGNSEGTRYLLVGDSEVRQWQPESGRDYHFYETLYERLYKSHGDFTLEIIEPFVAAYTNRNLDYQQIKEGSALLKSIRVADISRQYLLEELPIFSMLWDKGYQTAIYPGPLIFVDLLNTCEEPGLPDHWHNTGMLQITVKRRKHLWDIRQSP